MTLPDLRRCCKTVVVVKLIGFGGPMGEVQKKPSWLKLVLINFFVFVVLLVFLDIAAHYIPGLKPQQISLQIEDPLLGFPIRLTQITTPTVGKIRKS